MAVLFSFDPSLLSATLRMVFSRPPKVKRHIARDAEIR